MKSALFKLVIIITLSSSEMLNSITGFVQAISQDTSSSSSATNDTKETIITSFSPPIPTSASSLSSSTLAGSSPLIDNSLGESSSSSSATVNAVYPTSKDASDSKHDQLTQASTASIHHQHHPNHQNHQNHQSNYPIEPYPGASYTSSITISTPSPSSLVSTSFNQSTSGGSSGYASVSQPQFSSFSENNIGSFSNSYENQAAQLDRNQIVAPNNGMAENQNHNYGTQSKSGTNGAASLNTGLIQNLTASLFPIKQLSNATLYTLSELLNKTRQSGSYSHFTNGYKPTFNLAYPAHYSSIQNNQQSLGGTSSSSSSSSSSPSSSSPTNPVPQLINYPGLESSTLGNVEQQYNLFDYIRPSQFGFRQNSQASRFRPTQTTSSATKTTTLGSLQNHQQQYSNSFGSNLPSSSEHYFTASDNNMSPLTGYKTSSNIYNTYIPFKDNINSLPTMTNGQSLNMALYGYKLPLIMNKPFSTPSSNTNTNQNQNQNQNQNIGSGYHFIQHHNLNNQDHLDKIVYHSTPFRPSIVSPPVSATLSNPSNTTPSSISIPSTSLSPSPILNSNNQAPSSSLTSAASSSHHSSLNSQQRPSKPSPSGPLETKSLAFGSLSSSSSAISDSKSDYTTNGQANNASKYSSYKDTSSNSRAGGSENAGIHYSKSSINDKTTTTSTMSPLNSADNTDSGGSVFDGLRNNNSTIEKGNHGHLNHGQEMLFDLYEREIDNQIRDALYNEAPAHLGAESIIPGNIRAPQIAADWFDKSAAAQTLYGDPSGVEQALGSWERPVSLSSHGSSYLPIAGSANSATRIRAQPLHSILNDPLAEALQDLPTFSATDLQPIFPSGTAYSLITNPSHESTAYSDTQTAQTLTSSLNTHLFPLINHHHHQNPISLESELSNKYAAYHQPNSGHSTSTSTVSPTTSTLQPLSLQSLLYKLQSSPLSSLLSIPLTHFYSSLPKSQHKHNKKPLSSSSQLSHNKQNSSQQQTLLNQISLASPSSIFSSHTLGGISGKQLLNALSSGNSIFDSLAAAASSGSQKVVESPRIRSQHQKHQKQRQQAAIAAATANFLAAANAAAEHQSSMNPYQTAILQPQANSIFLNPTASETNGDLAMIGRTTIPGRIVHASPFVAEPPTHSNGGLSFGLTGGGITPMIWRSIFSPANWARKQSTSSSSGQSSSQLHNNINHHPPASPLQASSISPSISNSLTSSPSTTPVQINALQGSQKSSYQQTSGAVVGGNNVGGSALNLSISYNKQQLPQLNSLLTNQYGTKGINQRRPKIKIKILKIPVAYYDQTPISGSGLSSTPTTPSISLAPSQMQPAITASLLATLPCPLHHSTLQPAHSLEQHIANQASSISQGLSSSFPILASSSISSSPTSIHLSSGLDSPSSIQGFTDINQPNDLQVSSSNIQGKLLKILQQTAAA